MWWPWKKKVDEPPRPFNQEDHVVNLVTPAMEMFIDNYNHSLRESISIVLKSLSHVKRISYDPKVLEQKLLEKFARTTVLPVSEEYMHLYNYERARQKRLQ